MAYDGSLVFDTKIDNKGFQKGITGLKSIASGSLKVVNGLMKTTAVAVAGIGIASTKVGAEFESGMSQVAATMGITVDEINNGSKSFEMLEKAALDMGKSTQFSATDASEALNYLALAGYDAEKAVETLPKVLNLAAAGGLELGHASELVTQSMNALGLESDQLDSFVDQLAVTAQSSGTNVAQLGEAILTVGGTAKVMAGGTVELNTQLGILADAGIQGAEGGTALRNVLLALSAPTDKQAKAMKELGVSAYDSNGDLRHTDDIFQDLSKSLDGMSEKEKSEVLSNLFNKVDLKAANALLGASGDRFEELSAKIEKSEGAAADMAATMNDNLLGKIELLKSAMEYLGIMIYKSVDGPLVDVVETMTGYIDRISGVLTAHDDIIASAEELGVTVEDLGINLSEIPNGFEGVAEVIGEILAEIIISFAEAAPEMLEMGVLLITSLLDGIMDNMEAITESAVTVLVGFIEAYMEMLPEVMVLGIELIRSLVQGIAFHIHELVPVAIEMVETIASSLLENLPILIASGLEILLALVDGIIQALPNLIGVATEVITTLVEYIVTSLPDIIKAGLDIIKALVDGILNNLPVLIKAAPELIKSLVDGLIDNLPEIIKTGLELIKALVDGLIENIDLLVDAALQIVDSLSEFLIDNIDLLINAALDLVMAIVDGLVDNIDLLIDASLKLVLGIVEGLINNQPLLVEAGIKLVLGIINGLISAIPQLIASGIHLVTSLIGAILGLIPQIISTGVQLVGELVKGLISSIDTLVVAGESLVLSIISGIRASIVGIFNIGADIVRGLWEGIKSMKDWLLNQIKSFGGWVTKGFKDFFGIKSPSTLMAKYGKNIAEGLAMGIKDNQSKAEKAMYDMAQSIVKEYDRLGDAIITALERRYREEERIERNAIQKKIRDNQRASDEILKIWEKQYADRMKLIDREMSEEEKEIQDKIDAINDKTKLEEKAMREERYQKALSDKKKQIAQEEDDGRRLELQEELNEMIAQREREHLLEQRQMQIEGLREEMDKVRKQGQKKKEALEKEHQEKVEALKLRMQAIRDNYDDEMEATEKHYAELLTEERLQAEARRLILEENNDELIELLESYNPLWQNAGQSFGESLLAGLNSTKQAIKDEVADILSLVGEVDRAYSKSSHNKNESSYNDRQSSSNPTVHDHNIKLAKKSYDDAKARGDTEGMRRAHEHAERERALNNKVMSNMVRTMSIGTSSVINNDKGVTQNVTIVSPENTPSENARQMKNVGKELALGY